MIHSYRSDGPLGRLGLRLRCSLLSRLLAGSEGSERVQVQVLVRVTEKVIIPTSSPEIHYFLLLCIFLLPILYSSFFRIGIVMTLSERNEAME